MKLRFELLAFEMLRKVPEGMHELIRHHFVRLEEEEWEVQAPG